MKHLKISSYEYYAFAIITFATVFRLLLVGLGWPQTNSDEDTTGLMALHIAFRGEHPIFFYGQNYMGSFEAYVAAGFFHLFGASIFTLRLGSIFMFALFLVCMYLLTSLLYSKKLALVCLTLLSLGSWVMLNIQLVALSGYAETLLFGALALLLAYWLSLSHSTFLSRRKRWLRLFAFGGWGLVVGLGVWCNFLILPFVLLSGLFLLLFCWRDALSLAPIFLVLGLAIGASPLIIYNLSVPATQNTLTVLYDLDRGGSLELAKLPTAKLFPYELQLQGLSFITLPSATGAPPLCLDSDLKLNLATHHRLRCTLFHSGWSLAFTLLWLIAIACEIYGLWRLRRRHLSHREAFEEKHTITHHFARLFLLASVGFVLGLFLFSPKSAVWPVTGVRYLIGLLIATPALISPLWSGKGNFLPPLKLKFTTLTILFRRSPLLLLGIVFLVESVSILPNEIPTARVLNQQQYTLISDLLRIHATHIYTDYWTCNRIAFQSQERIICGVLNPVLLPDYNRYKHYLLVVQADPLTDYVFPLNSPEATYMIKKLAHSSTTYQHYVFDNYIIYQPLPKPSLTNKHTLSASSLHSRRYSYAENGADRYQSHP